MPRAPAGKFLGEGEGKRKKHGAEYRREWRKVHLGIDAQTLEIRAVKVTSNAIGDAPMPPELLAQIPSEEPIASVSVTVPTTPVAAWTRSPREVRRR